MPSLGLALAISVPRSAAMGPVAINYLLLETGDFFLLESDDKLIL